jgi:hypothetical protein
VTKTDKTVLLVGVMFLLFGTGSALAIPALKPRRPTPPRPPGPRPTPPTPTPTTPTWTRIPVKPGKPRSFTLAQAQTYALTFDFEAGDHAMTGAQWSKAMDDFVSVLAMQPLPPVPGLPPNVMHALALAPTKVTVPMHAPAVSNEIYLADMVRIGPLVHPKGT